MLNRSRSRCVTRCSQTRSTAEVARLVPVPRADLLEELDETARRSGSPHRRGLPRIPPERVAIRLTRSAPVRGPAASVVGPEESRFLERRKIQLGPGGLVGRQHEERGW